MNKKILLILLSIFTFNLAISAVYNINTGYDNSNAINAYVASVVHGDLA